MGERSMLVVRIIILRFEIVFQIEDSCSVFDQDFCAKIIEMIYLINFLNKFLLFLRELKNSIGFPVIIQLNVISKYIYGRNKPMNCIRTVLFMLEIVESFLSQVVFQRLLRF